MSASKEPNERNTGNSDPVYTKLSTNNLPWYIEEVGNQLHSDVRDILETYSNIPPDQVIPHIKVVRQKLWNIRAYPCTGVFAFLVPWIRYHSAFSDVVEKLKNDPNAKVVDVGCYIAHDCRALYFAGVPQSQIYGLDIIDFLGLGDELFNDTDKFSLIGRTVMGDILDFDEESDAAKLLDGKMDVVWCAAILHQFSWDKQVAACKRLIRYSRGTGSIVFGCIAGSFSGAGLMDVSKMTGGKASMAADPPFRHDAESMKKLWQEVGDDLDVSLKAQARVGTWEEFGIEQDRGDTVGKDAGVLEFTVRLL